MSFFKPNCLRCGTSMSVGFLADSGDSGYVVQGRWVEGLPESTRFLGMRTGAMDIKNRLILPLLAYRCPACYGVEFFAPREDESPQDLLRPASAEAETESVQLLRASDELDNGS